MFKVTVTVTVVVVVVKLMLILMLKVATVTQMILVKERGIHRCSNTAKTTSVSKHL